MMDSSENCDAYAYRFAEVGGRINRSLESMSESSKDRLMQRHIAATMGPEQKFESLGVLMNLVITQLQARERNSTDE